ncbi:hypothetical protein QVD17_23316 [Tagetes erecta]|uniref:Uncharacterized protein n=1 Tax=Tagetes erecta TaxID=13708 RepID=A0AAD8NU76_TARER|nr:hypothetical protein QVD17_23316 [Tagetes erecta]
MSSFIFVYPCKNIQGSNLSTRSHNAIIACIFPNVVFNIWVNEKSWIHDCLHILVFQQTLQVQLCNIKLFNG